MNQISERVNVAACLGLALLMFLQVSRAENASGNESRLLDRAKKKFTLNQAEEKLIQAFVNGELADYSDKSAENNDPNNAEEWDKETRSIKAEIVTWLCTDMEASAMVTHKGLWTKGVRIDGECDLEFGVVLFPLRFIRCAFAGGINLKYAEIRELNLIGTYAGPIHGSGLNVKGNVYLQDGFRAEGEVNLENATIDKDLSCIDGQFINKGAKALNANSLDVKGNVYLHNGYAEGEVHLVGTTVGRNLECNKAHFINPSGRAMNANSLDVKRNVYLHNGFRAEGEVHLVDATIGENLECDEGQFINPSGYALTANGANVDGSVFLRNNLRAEGEVNLVSATIGENLECSKGHFINKKGKALNALAVIVHGSIFFNSDFRAEGAVHLGNAMIGDRLDCRRGEFINFGGTALQADGVKVGSSVFMHEGFKAEGVVDLTAARIPLYFMWGDIRSRRRVKLALWSAKIGTLYDDAHSWPEPGNLYLHGLVYDEIDEKAPRDAKSRIDWLQRQYDKKVRKEKKQYRPQPYEQLAAVLRKSGQDDDAKKILIAKNKDKARLSQLTWSEKIWYRQLGPIIGYGYRPLNALWGVVAFVALGWILFRIGYCRGLITPQSESAYVERDTKIVIPGDDDRWLSDVYPRFNFLVYSLDAFVPLIDLHQAKYWLPNAGRGPRLLHVKGSALHAGGLLRLYLWVHITTGWAITMLLVTGLTGLIRT